MGLPIVLVKCTVGIDDTSLPPNQNNNSIYSHISPGVGAVIECEFKAVCNMEHFETLALVGCCAPCVGSCAPMFRCSLSVPSSSVKQSVNNYQHTLCNRPEERRSQLNRSGSLISPVEHFVFRITEGPVLF